MGEGQECHTPACALYLHASPGDIIAPELYEFADAAPAYQDALRLVAYGEFTDMRRWLEENVPPDKRGYGHEWHRVFNEWQAMKAVARTALLLARRGEDDGQT